VVAAAALAALLTSCTGSDDPKPEPPASASASASATAPVATPPASTAVVGEATATLSDGDIDVQVRSLTLDPNGTTMTLRVAYTPHFDPPSGLDTASLSALNGYFFLHPVLLDRANLKRYSVITGEGTQDWLTNDDAETSKDVPLESWAVYAAPQDPVTSMTFTIDQWGIELPDIPITQASS